MDSPFNKGFGPGHQSPALSHAPPAGSAYQVNVNRTKTRKWVEARVQSYDGDDWGADEYSDDEGAEPEPSVQQQSTQIPAASTGVAYLPSHLPTQRSQRAAPSHQPHPPSVASPAISEHSTTEKPVDRDKTVSSQFTGAHSSSRLVKQRPVDSLDGRGNSPHAEGDGGRRDSVSLQLPDVARMSSFGVDLFASAANGFAIEPTIPEHNSDALSSSPPARAIEKNKYDVSALVLDPSLSPPAARQTPPGMQQKRPFISHPFKEAPGGEPTMKAEGLSGNTTGEPSTEIAITNSDDKDRELDHVPSSVTADTVLAHPQARHPTLHLGSGWPTIQPLRTPSPRASVRNSAGQASSSGGFFNVVDRESTEASDAPKHGQPEHELESISLQREPTTSTAVSSLGKDNDILSDEILRSLSSGGSSSADPSTGDGRKRFFALNPNAARESSYTLQDYDSYWADTSDKAPTAPPFTATLESKGMVDSSSETPGPDENARVDNVDSRKRFSWEADEGRANSPSLDPAHQPSATHELADIPIARSEPGPTLPPDGTDGGAPSRAYAESRKTADPASGTVARSDGGQEPPEVPQPPSPLPASSDRQASVGRDCEKLSRSDEGAQAPDSSSVFSPTPPPESHTSPADQPPSEAAEPQSHPTHAPSMTFREILGLPAPAERITKYNETRNYFASADTGLNAWLESMQAQNPEYANGLEFLYPATSHPLAQAESHPSSAGAQPPAAQQPYFQQYLNATAPSTSSVGRSRPGGFSMPLQSTGSAFGHPSHQIGFKSKEFMHSAGKMGKGLLSKGKSKLRGSGDKVFH